MARKKKAEPVASPLVPLDAPGWARGAVGEATETQWFWEPWIPESALTLLVGDPERGKSTFLASCAAWLTNPVSDHKRDQAPRQHVLLVAGEEDWYSATLPRLLAAGCDPTRVIRADRLSRPGGRITVAELAAEAPALCTAHHVGLVIVDPLAACAPGDSDWNVEGAARLALEALQGLAETLRVAVIATRNTNKRQSGSLTDRINGSAAFRDVPRSIICCLADPLDSSRYVLVRAKGSAGGACRPLNYELDRSAGLVPVWHELGESALSAEELGDTPAVGGERLEWQAAHELLISLIGETGCEATKLLAAAQHLGIGKGKLWRAANELRIVRRRVGFGPGSHVMWSAPDGGFPGAKSMP